jgi:hypothetical protein
VAVSSQRFIEGPLCPLDRVTPHDRNTVIDGRHRTLTNGADNIQVHPLHDPNRHIGLHVLDMAGRHDVISESSSARRLGRAAGGPRHRPGPEDLHYRKDQLAVLIEADDAITATHGWRRDELIGRRNPDGIDPDDQERAIANWMDMVGRPDLERRVRLRHEHKDGSGPFPERPTSTSSTTPRTRTRIWSAGPTRSALLRHCARRTDATAPDRGATGWRAHVRRRRVIAYRNEVMPAIVGVTVASTVEDLLSTVDHLDRSSTATAPVGDALIPGDDADLEVSGHPPSAVFLGA